MVFNRKIGVTNVLVIRKNRGNLGKEGFAISE